MRPKGRLHADERIYFTYDNFLFSEELHDVVFQFEGSNEKIPAHSQILAFVSEVFRTQFFGSLPEKNIKIEDASIDNFRVFLRCIYTGELQVTLNNMFELAYLANKYLISKITEKVATFFKSKINEDDKFWRLFNPRMIALFDDEKQSAWSLLLSCFERSPPKYLNAVGFLLVNKDIIGQLLRTEPLAVKEADLFAAVVHWATHQCKRENAKPTESSLRKHVADFVHELRLPTLGLNALVYGKRIHSNHLLLQEEKVSLVSYCAGLVSQPIPFKKFPRQKSLDVLICPAAISRDQLYAKTILSHFIPQAHYRFLGLSCVLDICPVAGTSEPEQIKFELCTSDVFHVNGMGYDTLCSFQWKADSLMNVKNYEVTCMAEDIISLCSGEYYTLIMRPSSGISLHSFEGGFRDSSIVCLKANEAYQHLIKSFHLLRS